MQQQNKAPFQQYSFSAGMLDDTLEARQDVKQYYSGAREILNMVCQPHGGVTARGALRRRWEFPEMAGGFRLSKFEVSSEKGFITLFLDKKVVILDDDFRFDITTPYSGNELDGLDLNQSLDTMIITSAKYPPQSLLRKGTDTDWGLEPTQFRLPPQETYEDTTGGQNAIQSLKFESASKKNSFRLQLHGYNSKSVIWGEQEENVSRIQEALNNLEILDGKDGGVQVSFDDGEYRVEFVGTDGKQKWNDIIIKIEDASTSCRVTTKCIQEGKPPLEDVWSAKRGWQVSSCQHRGRLVFGGTMSRPNMFFLSMPNQSDICFRMTDEGLDDEGISAAVDADGNCVIHRVFSSDKLFITTNKGVFAVTESILTPTNTVPEKQTDVPCSKIRPVELNGTVVYITQTKTGIPQSVASITYSDDEKKYKTRDLAKLAYALMRRPCSFDVCKASLEKNATYLFVVNSDGTLAVLNTDDEELDGWMLCNTRNGEFLAVSVINDAPFFATKRNIGGQTRYFIEEWDNEANLDLSVELVSDEPKSLWTNDELAFYNGMTVGVYADGLAYGEVKIADGTLELDYPVKKIEVGIPFDWACETMPVTAELSDGTLVGNRHRFGKVTVRFKDSAGIFINGQEICNRYFGRDSWDKKEVLLNGTYTVRLLGWYGGNSDELATIRCSGTSLQPVTILSITAEVIQ